MKKYTWLDRLKDSSWVTIAWEWLQSLLGRAVDFILWVTMIFACYQLIPGAPPPPQGISVFMFILQFVALDIGGMGLRQLAQRHGLKEDAFTYKVAYACLGVTLVTLIFAGIQHAATVDPGVTAWVEVILVIARSGLTVLYGQAIRALKFIEHTEDDKTVKLEKDLAELQGRFDATQGQTNELRSQVQTQEKAYSVLSNERDALSFQVDLKQQELASVREMVSGGQDLTQQQVIKLQEQFDRAHNLTEQRLAKLQEQLDAEQNISQKLRLQLQSAELQKNEMIVNLRTANLHIEGLQKDLQNTKLQAEKLQKNAEVQTAKPSVRPAKLPANVTAFEDAKQRIPHADILAYIGSHPDLKRSEVAANLGISERKVYDAVAWGKEQDNENAVSR